MAIAPASASLALNGGVSSKQITSMKGLGLNLPQLAISHKSKQFKGRANLTVCAKREGSGGEGEFFAGFILGGAIFGALAYYYAPQIRRAVLNENEYGFRTPKPDNLYSSSGLYPDVYVYPGEDDGLEKTRKTLNSKIKQLNNAIDNVSSKLKENVASRFPGGNQKADDPQGVQGGNQKPPKGPHGIDLDGDIKYGV